MTEEINAQVDTILEGTEEVKPSKGRQSEKKPLSDTVLDCDNSKLLATIAKKDNKRRDFTIASLMGEIDKNLPFVVEQLTIMNLPRSKVFLSHFLDLSTGLTLDQSKVSENLEKLASEQFDFLGAIFAHSETFNEDSLKKVFSKNFDKELDQLKTAIEYKQNALNDFEKRYLEALSELRIHLKNQSNLQEEKKKPLEIPKEILTNDFFKLIKLSEDRAYFVTKPILLLDPRPVGCKPLNLGSFLVTIKIDNFSTESIKVTPFIGNIVAHGYSHPHVSSSGNICWGNGFAPAQKAVMEHDFKTLFKILYSLLSVYNHESPYVNMSDLHDYSAVRYSSGQGFRAMLNTKFWKGATKFIEENMIRTDRGNRNMYSSFASKTGINLFSDSGTAFNNNLFEKFLGMTEKVFPAKVKDVHIKKYPEEMKATALGVTVHGWMDTDSLCIKEEDGKMALYHIQKDEDGDIKAEIKISDTFSFNWEHVEFSTGRTFEQILIESKPQETT